MYRGRIIMIYCNEQERITLTDQNLSLIKKDNTVCYVFVGGKPGGTEGNVYVFAVENNELKIYSGNIFGHNLTKNKLAEIYPEATSFYDDWNFAIHIPGWTQIPFIVREKMAEDLQDNWKSVNAWNHFDRLVKGILITAQNYENEFVEAQTHADSIGKNTSNILCTVFDMYPNVWREPNRFKAILMDLFPKEKLKRNLLCICMEEQIPDVLFVKRTISNMEFSFYKKKLINACGCSDVLASEIISMWTEAFDIIVEDSSFD